MKVKDVMTHDVLVLKPSASVREAAKAMRDLDVGALPISDEQEQIVGIVTDRDIVARCVAEGHNFDDTRARDIMSEGVITCMEEDDVRDAARLMRERKIRRLLILNVNRELAGVVSLGDIAVETGDEELSGEALQDISEPKKPKK